jgi:ribosome maturation factor RimP
MRNPPPRLHWWEQPIDWDAHNERARIQTMIDNLRECVLDACRRTDHEAVTTLDAMVEKLKAELS